MVIKEEKRDLFSVDSDYALAHCIALDCAMGAGIATQFVKKYPNMRSVLRGILSENKMTYPCVIGYVGKDDRLIFNMITKEFSWGKPTYDTFECALDDLVAMCESANITKLAIPKIGCGLDRLNWSKVRGMIEEKFKDLDIEILVCFI